MTDAPTRNRPSWTTAVLALVSTRSTTTRVDAAIIPIRIALAWIFLYYGAGKLFGAFNGPGIHRTSLFFSEIAHLHPGGLFAVVGGVIEFAGAIAMALGLFSRLAGLALVGDQVMAMITVTWVHGINSLSSTPGYEFNMSLTVMALAIVVLGAGRFSIDSRIERRIRTGSSGPLPSETPLINESPESSMKFQQSPST